MKVNIAFTEPEKNLFEAIFQEVARDVKVVRNFQLPTKVAQPIMSTYWTIKYWEYSTPLPRSPRFNVYFVEYLTPHTRTHTDTRKCKR